MTGRAAPATPRVKHKGRSLAIVALTADGKLVCVDSTDPDRGRGVRVTGLAGDTRLIGIDHRPATGVLYGVGELGGLYTIDAGTGVASKVAQMSVVPSGTTFGVDFNPAVDRLRVVSDTQQNLRVDVTTGATITDLALSGAGVAGAAYTNNDADPNTVTTLFDIDAAADQVSVQAPANNGNLSPTGKLGVDTSNAVGLRHPQQAPQGLDGRCARLRLADGGRRERPVRREPADRQGAAPRQLLDRRWRTSPSRSTSSDRRVEGPPRRAAVPQRSNVLRTSAA